MFIYLEKIRNNGSLEFKSEIPKKVQKNLVHLLLYFLFKIIEFLSDFKLIKLYVLLYTEQSSHLPRHPLINTCLL